MEVATKPSNEVHTKASLIMEAIMVLEGPSLDSLPAAQCDLLKSAACKTLYLWHTPVSWYGPSEVTGMLTTPGIIFPDTDSDALPTDPVVRFHIQWVMEQARRGDFASGEEWEEYWRNPYRVAPEAWVPFLMAVPMEKHPPSSR